MHVFSFVVLLLALLADVMFITLTTGKSLRMTGGVLLAGYLFTGLCMVWPSVVLYAASTAICKTFYLVVILALLCYGQVPGFMKAGKFRPITASFATFNVVCKVVAFACAYALFVL